MQSADAPPWSFGKRGFLVPAQIAGVKLGKAPAGQSRRETELSNIRP
jgi:hypothetical protein